MEGESAQAVPAHARPRIVTVFTLLLLIGGLLTFYAGLSAAGFLVPAATMLLAAGLLGAGRGEPLLAAILHTNLLSGLVLVLVLAFGDGLGSHKLDVSGVALLLNNLAGGPMMSLVGLPLQITRLLGRSLHAWFSGTHARLR